MFLFHHKVNVFSGYHYSHIYWVTFTVSVAVPTFQIPYMLRMFAQDPWLIIWWIFFFFNWKLFCDTKNRRGSLYIDCQHVSIAIFFLKHMEYVICMTNKYTAFSQFSILILKNTPQHVRPQNTTEN